MAYEITKSNSYIVNVDNNNRIFVVKAWNHVEARNKAERYLYTCSYIYNNFEIYALNGIIE